MDFRRPIFDPIRQDPRFVALLKDAKLPTARPAPMTGRLIVDKAATGL
jgi:hypothetical protein